MAVYNYDSVFTLRQEGRLLQPTFLLNKYPYWQFQQLP